MTRSIKSNFIFNLLNTGTQLLFPLITFPYASRIMLADGIGHVNFFQSIVSYISLFTCLGIPLYAIREIARSRKDFSKMSVTVVEILLLHAMLTILGYIAVAVICMSVAKVQTDIPLFIILSSSIFFTAIGCEWFYQGIEDFKYVAIRGFIVRSISIVFLFTLVKTKDDILWYGVYSVLGVLGGNILNFIRLRKYIGIKDIDFHMLHPLRHIKPVLLVFSLNVIISIYIQLNNILLGFMSSETAVGYFTAATKLLTAAMSISSALGCVMVPRASNLIAENKKEEFKAVIQKSYDFIIAFTVPLYFGLIFTSRSAVLLLSGSSFEPAILASQIVAGNIISVSLSNIMGLQVLYPMGKISIVILCTFIGAVVNVILNVLLIPYYGHIGTAVAYVLAEISVTVSMFIIGRKYFPIRFFKRQHFNSVFASLLMLIMLYYIATLRYGNIVTFVLMLITGSFIYSVTLIVLRDPISLIITSTLKRNFKRKLKTICDDTII